MRFRNRRLQRWFEQDGEAFRAWGPDVGRRYIARVTTLMSADSVSDLYGARFMDFHPLTGDRRGQHAIRLTGRMRLIVTVENPRVVMIEEVVDYHG